MSNVVVFWDNLGYNRFFLVLLIVLFFVHLFSILYRGMILVRSGRKQGENQKEEEGVSVIITCSNKAALLKENLEAFLTQDYPEYEVIVVDECSEDETQDVLSDFQQKYPHLRTSRIFPDTKFRRTKKIAINIGVLAARYDVLLFTEIECIPESRQWVRTMQSYFGPDTAVVLGYANYAPDGEKLSLRRYFRFLWFWKMMVLVRWEMFVAGNGYNMGYRKKYYLEERGFSGNTQEYIGYDSEMVRELAGKGSVRVVKDPETRMILAKEGKKAWRDDYAYHYASVRRWPWSVRIWSDLDFWGEALLYAMVIYFIFRPVLHYYIFLVPVLTFLMDFIVINIGLRHLGQKKLFLTSLTVNMLGFVYKWYYNIYSIFATKKWR